MEHDLRVGKGPTMQWVTVDGEVVEKPPRVRGQMSGLRLRVVSDDWGESPVVQSDKESADLNVIVAQWLRGEYVPPVPEPLFADVTQFESYQDVLNVVASVRQTFENLPAWLRAEFENSEVKFVEYMTDPNTLAERVELGLSQSPPKGEGGSSPEAAPAGGQGGGAPASGQDPAQLDLVKEKA